MKGALDQPVQFIKGVGPRRAAQLGRLGIRTLEDLLYTIPSTYYDRRSMTPLDALVPGERATVQGVVVKARASRTRRRLSVVEVTIEAGTRRAYLVWFGQPYREKEFSAGDRVVATGRVRDDRARIAVEECEIVGEGEDPLHAAGLVPAYPATEGLSKRQLRSLIQTALDDVLDQVPEVLPDEVRRRRGLISVREALRRVHRPDTPQEAERARKGLAFQELFALQAYLAVKRRSSGDTVEAPPLAVNKTLDFRIRSLFPFRLTRAQERAVKEIRNDLARERPMNRLLQGDVGAGKTGVAAYALLAAVGRRAQAALLAPTEILAEQHLRTFRRMLGESRVRIGFLGGGMAPRERKKLLAALAAGELDLLIGTHAILEKDVAFRNLALVVVDEQQKFGVLQRATFVKKGEGPHRLVMTATPIPRTLALTAYGDLDVSVIDQLPPGRKHVTTLHVPATGRKQKMRFIRAKLKEGRQAYFVYPLVDDSDRIALKSAIRMHGELQREFSEFTVALLHGRMSQEEKDDAMAAFRAGRTHVLVSTIVIEVGIDVPNASVMVIDHCERYGLSQLHQLRGRIGRGPHESYCILFGGRSARIDVFVSTGDGFRIAEADLRLRGAGDLEGTRQSGLPLFRAARLPGDQAILERARQDAFAWVEADPSLGKAPALREYLERRGSDTLIHVG